MMKWIRKVIGVACLFVGFASGGFGQNTGQNVVTVPVVVNQTISATTTFTTPSVSGQSLQNIGQSSHTLVTQVTGVTGSGGATWNVYLEIDGSPDGVNWINISVPTQTVNYTLLTGRVSNNQCSGFQTYPYVRTVVTVTIAGTGSVIVNGTYIGNSTPSHNLIDSLAGDGGLMTISVGNLSSGGTSVTPGVTIPATLHFTVYAYSLIVNQSSGSTVGTVQIGCGNATITDNQFVTYTDDGKAKMVLAMPAGLRAYVQCNQGEGIWFIGSGNTASLSLTYRLE
jgi:hypothetical protein